MSLDPNKTYLVWNGTEFPNSTNAQFKAPAGSTIDWGDGTVETFNTASTSVNTHTYTDGKTEHTIAISGLTSISNDWFKGCISLTSITIPNSVTSIGDAVFLGCSSLTSVTIGNSVTSIGAYAFYNNSSLTSVTIGNSVTIIGADAFEYCISLTSITIPNSVTSIGGAAFLGCSSLMSITIPDSVTSIGEAAFFNTAYYKDENNWGNGVLYIGKHLIKAKTDLSNTYTIKDGTLTIADSAFSGCSSLTGVTIGNSVTSIGTSVFYGCSSLTQLILFPSTPPTLGSNAIPDNVQSIYVQQSSKATYQAATNWTTFASKIVSDNIYLSFVRFNQKNKEYINGKVDEVKQYIDNKIAELISNKV